MAKRLLFVNQHYWPDVAATGQILTDLAEHCAARGFEVEVLTGKAKYVSGGLDAPAEEVRNGVRIRRLATTSCTSTATDEEPSWVAPKPWIF